MTLIDNESRKEGKRRISSNEDSVDEVVQGQEENINNSKQKLITIAIHSNKKFTKDNNSRKNKWDEKQLDAYFKGQTSLVEFDLVWFYGVSIIIGYLIPNLIFTYILNIIRKHIL